ncbi:MAG: hypothetical protein F4139_05905 [Gemmatimonadetes bacterium]|nr:hypothetical protein [Gemmatimonadota bacterium]MYH52468.1 hypothetical protein [Gemmatimonadota bacterium]MYK66688.1 hypothetical protein [Gemmatimonadota bacterium]
MDRVQGVHADRDPDHPAGGDSAGGGRLGGVARRDGGREPSDGGGRRRADGGARGGGLDRCCRALRVSRPRASPPRCSGGSW